MTGNFHGRNSVRCALLIVLVFCTLVVAPAAWSQGEYQPWQLASIPSVGRFDYEVIREGEKIGTHSVAFRHDGRHLTISTQTDIAVALLGITLYRFHYEAEEDWFDGRLTRLTSQTDKDGVRLDVDLGLSRGRIHGTCNGTTLDLPADLLPASAWHPNVVHVSTLFDQYNCVERQVHAVDLGIESTFVNGLELTSRHYVISGQLRRDIWYGLQGQPVQVRFPAKDGSDIIFVLLVPSARPIVAAQHASTSPVRRAR